ncbi:terpenoid synthase [Hygrophoropsis aurantiaca]|uniref:Terpenoid synthase n=1 Tax=Hygrophoropsis aurantiaca TaxID=72124 RepID=A0ACB8A4Q8_9AGAM|nr:terpenoid synthase [Hygrophoropsis aurantiaca]
MDAESNLMAISFLQPCLDQVRAQMLDDLSSTIPQLTEVYQYYVQMHSKRLRPTLIPLMAQATNGLARLWSSKDPRCDCSGTEQEYLNYDVGGSALANVILPEQLRLAAIIEMVHVASLMHDDVLDESFLRRGAPSAPCRFGTKQSVLGGDFLLTRAVILSTTLGELEVISEVAKILQTLVEGELLQAQSQSQSQSQGSSKLKWDTQLLEPSLLTQDVATSHWDSYLDKTYRKTASLFAHALRCAVILGGAAESDPLRKTATEYGSQLGMAFQIIDDVLDFNGDDSIGKPIGADVELGLATAPILFALEENEDLQPLVDRRFREPGDVQTAIQIVKATNALARSTALASLYAQKAHDALISLPESPSKAALQALAMGAVSRDH